MIHEHMSKWNEFLAGSFFFESIIQVYPLRSLAANWSQQIDDFCSFVADRSFLVAYKFLDVMTYATYNDLCGIQFLPMLHTQALHAAKIAMCNKSNTDTSVKLLVTPNPSLHPPYISYLPTLVSLLMIS